MGYQNPQVSPFELLTRKPQRISLTVSWQLKQRLQDQADVSGRSLSNWASYLLEAAADARSQP